MAVPHKKDLMVPVLGALSRLGGSGTLVEILTAVSEMMGLTKSDLQQTFPRTGQKIAKKRVGDTLTALKTAGCVDYTRNSWMWSLTEAGRVAWAEAEGGPEAAQEVAARLRAEITRLRAEARRVKREHNKAQRAKKAGAPAAAGSYEHGYSAGAEAGRSEAKLMVKHWLGAYSKGGGEAALDELRRWANG